MSVARSHLGDDLLWGVPALCWAWVLQPVLGFVALTLWVEWRGDPYAGLIVFLLAPLLWVSNTAWWGWSMLVGARTRWGRRAGGGAVAVALVTGALGAWACMTGLNSWVPGAVALVTLGGGALAALGGLGLPDTWRGDEEFASRRRGAMGLCVGGSMLLPLLWCARAAVSWASGAEEVAMWGAALAVMITLAPAVAAHLSVRARRGEVELGATARHMLKAAAVNLWRAPTYARLSRGRSLSSRKASRPAGR